jgi:hypothetical protein
MTKRETDARCAYVVCKCALHTTTAIRETLSWKDSKAVDEIYSAESALNRLLLILNNRITEEVQKRRKQ